MGLFNRFRTKKSETPEPAFKLNPGESFSELRGPTTFELVRPEHQDFLALCLRTHEYLHQFIMCYNERKSEGANREGYGAFKGEKEKILKGLEDSLQEFRRRSISNFFHIFFIVQQWMESRLMFVKPL